MSWYLVTLEGGPIPLAPQLKDVDTPIELVGFFTTRKARARTEPEAVSFAIEDAISELRESLLANSVDVPPCRAIWIRAQTWIEVVRRRYRGFTFYSWPATH